MSSLYDIPLRTLGGEPTTLAEHQGKALLVVNVASRCGFTPQYAGLEALHEEYADRGFAVLGFPCNQFKGQEPGTSEEIAEFCSATYGITFPMYEKVDVKGEDQHPLYAVLTERADDDGNAGDVGWNFEKFLVSAEGQVVRRFRTNVVPEDPRLVEAVTAALPQ